MDLSVIIVNWNAREDLARCLQSLPGAAGDLRCEVLVVDNASSDGSAAMVRRRFPEVRLLALRENLGFAAANNLGMEATSGRYRLLLNPDTLVHGQALADLVRYADEHPRAGLVGPMLLNGDGSRQASCRRFPTLPALLFRGTPLGRLLPNNPWAASYLMEEVPTEQPSEVDWLSGACLLARWEMVQGIGALDPGYFMYVEDMDWCLRAHQSGWSVVYLPEAAVTHLIGRSSDKRPRAMIIEHHRSMWRYMAKHHGPLVAALALPLLLARAAVILLVNRLG